MKLIELKSLKTPKEIIKKVKKIAFNFNFIVREVFNMKNEFKHHGVDVDESFEYYSILICNPQKAYDSISKNGIRGAVLLPPKQIVIYKENEKTMISYFAIEEDDIKKMLPKDESFQKGLSQSCTNIIKLIEEIK
jgi:uncharacterized protein (DUF302 family)